MQGSKEDPKGPGQPLKFYPNDPSQLPQSPIPGTLSSPSDPNFTPVTGKLRPDSPPPAYSFEPFPQGTHGETKIVLVYRLNYFLLSGTFTPDDTRVPHPGGVEQPQFYGGPTNFYPNNPSG